MDFGDLAGEIRDEQPISDEGRVVQAGVEIGQHRLLAGARVDAQHLPAVHLGRHDVARRIELDRIRHAEAGGNGFGGTAVRVAPPDFVGAHHREVQQAVRADLHRVGGRDILQQYPRRATAQVKFEKAAAFPALADQQPTLVDGDSVGGRDIVAQYPGVAVGTTCADPAVHDLGGVKVAARVESHVVGRDDVAALGADGFQSAGLDVDGTDLAAGYLCDVDSAVRAGPQTVGAEQPARRGNPLQAPALGEAR